jgi:hypothetical protein
VVAVLSVSGGGWQIMTLSELFLTWWAVLTVSGIRF